MSDESESSRWLVPVPADRPQRQSTADLTVVRVGEATEADEYEVGIEAGPKGHVVTLTGSKEAVQRAAAFLYRKVRLVPAEE